MVYKWKLKIGLDFANQVDCYSLIEWQRNFVAMHDSKLYKSSQPRVTAIRPDTLQTAFSLLIESEREVDDQEFCSIYLSGGENACIQNHERSKYATFLYPSYLCTL